MTKKKNNPFDESVHHCLVYRGEADSCASCPLKKENLCGALCASLKKWNFHMNKNFSWKLGRDEQRDILSDTVMEIIQNLNQLRNARAFNSWAYRIFHSSMSRYMTKMPRTGRISYKLKTPPENLDAICKSLSGHLGWNNLTGEIELLSYPLKSSIKEKAKTIAKCSDVISREEWDLTLDKLYRLSKTYNIVETEEENISSDPDTGLESTLDEDPAMLKVFTRKQTKWAQGCATIYRELLKNDNNLEKTAQKLGITYDSLRKKKSNCATKYRKELVRLLRSASGEKVELCYHLLQDVFFSFRETLKAKERKAPTVIKMYSEKHNIPLDFLDRKIRKCRLLALEILEENYA